MIKWANGNDSINGNYDSNGNDEIVVLTSSIIENEELLLLLVMCEMTQMIMIK